MDHLVRVCKAIPGFCKRSQKLSGSARRAIIGAFFQSGQTLPPAAQRYVDQHGDVENVPEQRCIDYPGSAHSPTGEQTGNFRAEEASQNSPTGLHALVAAADQVEAQKSGSGSGNPQHGSERDTQAQQQLGAQNEGLIAGQVLGLASYETGSNPAATYGQDMHSPWRMSTEESWPQQVAVRHMPDDGVQGLPQSAHCHTSMATGAPIPPAQWWPRVVLHGRQDTMTPNIPLYSGLDQAGRIVTPNGLCTTQDWNEAVRNTLAQFEDGSTDDWEKAAQEALAQFGNG